MPSRFWRKIARLQKVSSPGIRTTPRATMSWIMRPNGFIEYVSQEWSNFTGLNLKQIQRWCWLSIVHIDDIVSCRDAEVRAFQTGDAYEGTFRCRRASDGEYRTIYVRGLPALDAKGRVKNVTGYWFDVTEAVAGLRRARYAARPARLTT